ncbi:MAG TPA: GTPase HflX [Clostridiaceae bacterium]|nr:GTPase HflX [Clostridiaceae bacterium]
MNSTTLIEEKALLIGLDDDAGSRGLAARSLDELAELVENCGAGVVGRLTQKRAAPDTATWIGSGKLEEAFLLADSVSATMLVLDDELSPRQLRNIAAQTQLKVLDRTAIILDIFARRAISEEGKIQVELAQLRYRMTQLTGYGEALSRLGGGIGTRGPGESKLESDRRHIMRRVSALRRRLEEISKRRSVFRAQRKKHDVSVIAVVGYTNAGKSTLTNALCGSDIAAADQLFMTLDPTVRRLEEDGQRIVLVDTVGFIRNLPKFLAEAFKATLEEVTAADAVMIVVDASDPDASDQLNVVFDQLERLDASSKPTLLVINKIDAATEDQINDVRTTGRLKVDESLQISAVQGWGLDKLRTYLLNWPKANLVPISILLDYADAGLVNHLQNYGDVESIQYETNGMRLRGAVEARYLKPFLPYLKKGGRT